MIKNALAGLARKLARLGRLGEAEVRAIQAMPCRVEKVPARRTLVREGDVPSSCCILLEGYACRHKSTRQGARQIVSFHLAGDILDLQHIELPRADHDVETITPATVAWVPVQEMRNVLQRFPAVNDALWRDALIDAAIFREWVLNVGRRDAKRRIAHLLCEFACRCEDAGLGAAERFDLPMTQEVIADATGLTVVHVNRTLGALTRDGLISRKGREYRIADWSGMCEFADFDAAYLYQSA